MGNGVRDGRGLVARLGAILVSALVAAGCTQAVGGTAVVDSEAFETRLTGGLPTVPRVVAGNQAQRKTFGAFALADRTVAPFEVDGTLTRAGGVPGSPMPFASASQLGAFQISNEQASLVERRGMMYAFTSGRRASTRVGGGNLTITLLRMTNAASADGLVSDMAAQQFERIAGRGNAVAKVSVDSSSSTSVATVRAFAAYGEHVVLVIAVHDDEATARTRIASTLDREQVLLAGFTSPELAAMPLDTDSLLSHTVAPRSAPEGSSLSYEGIRTRRADLHYWSDPAGTAKLFDEVGMDLVGAGRNTVHRTRDAAGAKLLAGKWLAEIAVQGEPIAGVPEARCGSSSSPLGTREVSCYVAVGRYVSSYSGPQADEVKKVTAAAYLILRGFR